MRNTETKPDSFVNFVLGTVENYCFQWCTAEKCFIHCPLRMLADRCKIYCVESPIENI